MGKMHMTLQTARTIIVGLLLLALGGVVGYRYGQRNMLPTQIPLTSIINTQVPKDKENVDFGVFWEVWNDLDQKYLNTNELDSKKMVNGAITGMTAAIGDPYTHYLPPSDNQQVAADLAGSFGGIGAELGYVKEVLAVVAPLKDTPAEKVGLQPGDLILHVKDTAKNLDEDTLGWTLDQAVDKIRGPIGTTVTLTILRNKDDDKAQPFTVDVQRSEIVVKSVELDFPEFEGKKVAHIKLSKFGERTTDEFEDVVKQILQHRSEIKGIVLDMRNNPGGLFDDAIAVASEFIPKGTVVIQKGKFTEKPYSVNPPTGKAQLAGIPLVVLVNGGSASASEIVAGALRDDLNAKLVGEKTFGKGTVQDRLPLSNGGGLHVTIAQWLLPKGDWIHKKGIDVSVEAKDDPATKDVDEALNKAIGAL